MIRRNNRLRLFRSQSFLSIFLLKWLHLYLWTLECVVNSWNRSVMSVVVNNMVKQTNWSLPEDKFLSNWVEMWSWKAILVFPKWLKMRCPVRQVCVKTNYQQQILIRNPMIASVKHCWYSYYNPISYFGKPKIGIFVQI